MPFRFVPQEIPEVLLVEADTYNDARGFFLETYRERDFSAAGLPRFVQDNHSRSTRGVLRGLHWQVAPAAMAKLVRCVRGRIFDVAVDVRPDASTFGAFVTAVLDGETGRMLYVPEGFAHGFCVLSDVADVVYRQSAYYSKEHERTLRYDDPSIGIPWPVDDPILSEKDAEAPALKELFPGGDA